MTRNGIEFAKRVGIVSGALLATVSLGGVLWSFTAATVLRPVIEQVVKEERLARIAADSTLAVQLSVLSRDRIDLLDYLGAKDRNEARLLLSRIRERWSRE